MDIYERLRRFDIVLAHTFGRLISKQKGAELPPFMETEKFEEARLYTLALSRDGALDIMYERIMEGKI